MLNEQFDLLVSLMPGQPGRMIGACRSVVVAGLSQRDAAILHGVNSEELARALQAFEKTDNTVLSLMRFYRRGRCNCV